jgi:acyl-coenzyme A thioesterase PaaI-like protein
VVRLPGLVAKEGEPGRAAFEVRAEERHHNPPGTLHRDLADAAKGLKAGVTLGYVGCEVKDELGRLAARAADTCAKREGG